MKLNIYPAPRLAAYALIDRILQCIGQQPGNTFNMAFSGGSTPALMFDLWAREMSRDTPWQRINVWWVDERCVPPEDADSNYGLMHKLLLSAVPIPPENVFRIRGEENPAAEAERYSEAVMKHVSRRGRCPSFDMVLLGIGSDGHTSSIFPKQEQLLSSAHLYEVSENPYNKQKRIALTGIPIIHAQRVMFLATGKEKAAAVAEAYHPGDATPAAYIAHHARRVEFFTDKAAASLLSPDGREE